MKLVIDIDDKLVCKGFERNFTEEERKIMIRAIGNGTPYEERTHGKWIIAEVQCPNCFMYTELDYCPNGELNKCPKCGAENGLIRQNEKS